MRAALLILILLLAGCGAARPLYGTVVRKIYHPAWTETQWVSTGKGTGYPTTVHHPAEWRFVIQKEETTGVEGQQLIITSEAEYNRLDVGRTWYRADTVIEK